ARALPRLPALLRRRARPVLGRLAARGDPARLEPLAQRADLHRPREQEALDEAATEGAQRAQLPVRLDALDDEVQPQRAGQANDGGHDRGVAVAVGAELRD